MRNIAILGLLCTATIGATVFDKSHAADLDPAYPAPAAYGEPDAPFELGTGWYLRGDVGYSDSTRERLLDGLPNLTSSTDWTGGFGAGYRWNNWFRTDLTLNFDGYQDASHTTDPVTCVYSLTGQVTQDTPPLKTGYFWTPNLGTCDGHNRASILKNDVTVGGYIDLGTWYGLTPYVGAGVGFARIDTFTSTNYSKTSDGSPYKADLTASGSAGDYPLIWRDEYGNALNPVVPTTKQPVAFSKQNWSTSGHQTRYNFAWSLSGGVAYALDEHLALDVGYRYINMGDYKDTTGVSRTIDAQQVRVGLRYAID